METGYCQIQMNKYQQKQNEYHQMHNEHQNNAEIKLTTGIKSSMDIPVPMQNMYKQIQKTNSLNVKAHLNKMTIDYLQKEYKYQRYKGGDRDLAD